MHALKRDAEERQAAGGGWQAADGGRQTSGRHTCSNFVLLGGSDGDGDGDGRG